MNIEMLHSLIESAPSVSPALEREVQAPGTIRLFMGSQLMRIEENSVTLRDADGREQVLENSAVFSMIGRQAPSTFFDAVA